MDSPCCFSFSLIRGINFHCSLLSSSTSAQLNRTQLLENLAFSEFSELWLLISSSWSCCYNSASSACMLRRLWMLREENWETFPTFGYLSIRAAILVYPFILDSKSIVKIAKLVHFICSDDGQSDVLGVACRLRGRDFEPSVGTGWGKRPFCSEIWSSIHPLCLQLSK